MKNLVVIVVCSLMLGCAGAKIHPGAANAFDSTTADILVDTQNVLQGLSKNLADYPKALAPMNEARSQYNIWKNDYLLYRCAAGYAPTLGPGGKPCPVGVPVTQAQVQADQSKTQNAVATVQAAEGKK